MRAVTGAGAAAFARRLRPWAVFAIALGLSAMAWPAYRKFFINEWRERITAGQSVVFIPDCPVISPRFKCDDRYTLSYYASGDGKWCARVRKNEEPARPESCGLDVDAWDFARSWRYFTIEEVRLYYSWRGRVISSPNDTAGWLVTSETLALRNDHPLPMR